MFRGSQQTSGRRFSTSFAGRGGASPKADVDAGPCARSVPPLLEADVALPVVAPVHRFGTAPKAIGADVISSVLAGPDGPSRSSMITWSRCWAATVSDLDLNAIPPVVILMVGLQGLGAKTTSSAKIGYRPEPGPAGHGRPNSAAASRSRRRVHDGLARQPAGRAAQQQLANPGPADRRADPADRAARRCRSPSRGARWRRAPARGLRCADPRHGGPPVDR